MEKMSTHPCQPCAKRKVRCDRQQPCSNCKRRRKDTCTYIEASPWARIKELEALVRQLSKRPEQENGVDQIPTPALSSARGSSFPQTPKADKLQGNDPTLAEECGENVYLESTAWFAWNGKSIKGVQKGSEGLSYASPTDNEGALVSVLRSDSSINFAQLHPTPEKATALWSIFNQSVDFLIKIAFENELEQLRIQAIAPSPTFSDPEFAFVFALYLVTAVGLSDEECWQQLDRSRSDLIAQYQMLCEQALVRSDFLGASNITILRALALYIAAGSRRISNRNLWGLMGIAIRSAERLGLHRDGTFLNLSPYETERRRRVWWQLQQLDVFLAIWAGSPSITLQGAWDTRLPLNIEDSDLDPQAKDFPKEREGLTRMSFCLWRYWILSEQRSSYRPDGSPIGFAWASDKSLSHATKQDFVDQLEAGLRTKFLQHCDPIRPRDLLIQLTARACICTFRLLTLHPLAYNGGAESRNELLDTSIRCLEYDVAIQSADSLKCFRLRMKGFFQWPAFIHVLSEATQQINNSSKATKIWNLLIDVYATNTSLLDLTDDPRKLHAAELMTAAWKSRKRLLGVRPDFNQPAPLAQLETRVMEAKEQQIEHSEPPHAQESLVATQDPPVTQDLEIMAVDAMDMNAVTELTFDDIDWSFWLGLEFSN